MHGGKYTGPKTEARRPNIGRVIQKVRGDPGRCFEALKSCQATGTWVGPWTPQSLQEVIVGKTERRKAFGYYLFEANG
jgi:hypothetical protein